MVLWEGGWNGWGPSYHLDIIGVTLKRRILLLKFRRLEEQLIEACVLVIRLLSLARYDNSFQIKTPLHSTPGYR